MSVHENLKAALREGLVWPREETWRAGDLETAFFNLAATVDLLSSSEKLDHDSLFFSMSGVFESIKTEPVIFRRICIIK